MALEIELIIKLKEIAEKQQKQIERLQKDCKYNYDLIWKLAKILRSEPC